MRCTGFWSTLSWRILWKSGAASVQGRVKITTIESCFRTDGTLFLIKQTCPQTRVEHRDLNQRRNCRTWIENRLSRDAWLQGPGIVFVCKQQLSVVWEFVRRRDLSNTTVSDNTIGNKRVCCFKSEFEVENTPFSSLKMHFTDRLYHAELRRSAAVSERELRGTTMIESLFLGDWQSSLLLLPIRSNVWRRKRPWIE